MRCEGRELLTPAIVGDLLSRREVEGSYVVVDPKLYRGGAGLWRRRGEAEVGRRERQDVEEGREDSEVVDDERVMKLGQERQDRQESC